MQKLIYGVGGLLLALVLIGFALPRQSRFIVTVDIDAHPATVFAQLNDLRRSNLWAPITAIDPNAQVVFSGPIRGVDASVSWDGALSGSGRQTITVSRPHDYVETMLNAGEPGEARSWFELDGGFGRTRVSRGFEHDYGLNIVGRYFGLMVTGVIRRAYQDSLADLKEFAESLPTADFSDLDIEQTMVEASSVALLQASSSPDPAAISEAMGDAYLQILNFIDRHGLADAGAPIAIMRAPRGAELRFDAAIAIRGLTDDTPRSAGNVRVGRTYAGSVLRVRHTGSYRTLSDTHRKIQAYLAVLGIERNGAAWEAYVSDRGAVDEAELLTWVYYPIREQ